MFGIQSKITRQMKKQENGTHHKKDQSLKNKLGNDREDEVSGKAMKRNER